MIEPDLSARVEAARAALVPAADLALAYFRDLASLTVERKTGGQDVVSRADRDVETLLRAALAPAFPDDAFLGEEHGRAEGSSGWVWIIDPIDGTSNYLHGLTEWCISVGLAHDGALVAGLIAVPCRGELFVASAGAGATHNGQPIRVTATDTLRTGLTGIGASVYSVPAEIGGLVSRVLAGGGMFVRGGSGALALAHVACGHLVAYHEPFMYLWDCAAGLCLVREAGGEFRAFVSDPDRPMSGAVTAWAPQERADITAILAPETPAGS